MELTIAKHCVGNDPESGLSQLQEKLLKQPEKIRIAEAPTGAGKSYAFQRAMLKGDRVLFIVPTRRLAQNLVSGLMESLVGIAGWSADAAKKKLALWCSDETERLKEAGVTNIGAMRVREIYGLNLGIEGGEMIVAVPEVVSSLLLRYCPIKGQADAGVFEILNNFEHIVFDEFHTISFRGFGLAGLFAKLAAQYPASRAKITFLSATPVDIQPVLTRLQVPEEDIVSLHENLTPDGRVVHGDVRLTLCDCENMTSLLKTYVAEIKREVEKGRQVVIIYNKLYDLQHHFALLEQILKDAGIKHGQTLVINSIDDSRVNVQDKSFFTAGRRHDPEQFDVLIATASVEMGVTFKANLLIMEPGFEPLNFLQRYGRAARGDHKGHVIVRLDDSLINKNTWLKRLRKWVDNHQGQTLEIVDLTDILSKEVKKRFKECPEQGQKHFGKLPNRAAYSTGLYWNVLMQHFSNQGHRWKHLQKYKPAPARQIYFLLKKVREMESDRMLEKSVKDWCDRFEQEARTLRDIGKGVRVVEDTNESFYAQEFWLRRNTDILDRFPLMLADDGVEEIRIKGTLQSNLLDKSRFIEAVRNTRFPHTLYTVPIHDGPFLIKEWCKEFKNKTGSESWAWEIHPEAMDAAEQLVRLTGLVVNDDTEPLDACSGVL